MKVSSWWYEIRHLMPFGGKLCEEGSGILGISAFSSYSRWLSPMGRRLCWAENGSPSPADLAAPGKVKPELCNGFSLCFSWDFSFAPIPYTLSFLQRAVPYSFWAWPQKHWDDKRSQKRVALILVSLGTFSMEIRETQPPKYRKKMMKGLLMKSYSSLNWTGIFIINVIVMI